MNGANISVKSLHGFVVVIGFVNKTACSTGGTLEVLDEIYLDVGPSRIRCFGCIVDLELGEPIPQWSPFAIPIGAASRRSVAEFLGVQMSGFYLPQFVIIDKNGTHRLRCIACGDDWWDVINNLRFPIDAIVDEVSQNGQGQDRGGDTIDLRSSELS